MEELSKKTLEIMRSLIKDRISERRGVLSRKAIFMAPREIERQLLGIHYLNQKLRSIENKLK